MDWYRQICSCCKLVLTLAAAGSSGCSRNSYEAPPAQQVHDAIAAAVPAYFTLHKLEQEVIANGLENAKINFKATVVISEDLFTVEREVGGVKLLKRTQAGRAKVVLYGHLLAHRLLDQWTLGPPRFQIDLRFYGWPRGAFGQHACLVGSAEAADVLRRQAAEAEKARQLQQAVAEQEECSRRARLEELAREEQERKTQLIKTQEQNRRLDEQRRKAAEQRERAAAATRRRLLAATAPAVRYSGNWVGYNGSMQQLVLVFREQQDVHIRAEAGHPDDAKAKRLFSGELFFNALPENNGAPVYPIVLHGLPSNKVSPARNSLYERPMDLKLYLTEQGLDGIADAGLGEHFPIHLQRTDNAAAK